MIIRIYNPLTDYQGVKDLYLNGDNFGGQFDEIRDSKEKLGLICDHILVAEVGNQIVGTVTLFEDKRSAWLYRFAVNDNNEQELIEQLLYDQICIIAKDLGHKELLIYAPRNHKKLQERYLKLGMNQGGEYICFWNKI